MKTKIQSGLAAVLILLIFSCSKDNGNTTGSGSTRVSSSQSSFAVASSTDDASPVSIVGTWVVYYDWDCNGGPGIVTKTFNADGTWTDSEGYTGLWITGKHILTFIFTNGNPDFKTTYSGIIGVKEVQGIQSTFQYAGSLSGCFHMDPYTGSVATQKDGGIDGSGKSK